MKIWTLRISDDNGENTELFFSKEEANIQARDWTREYLDADQQETVTAENWADVWDILRNSPWFADSLDMEDFDLSDHPTMIEARGVIDGLITQIDQMRGMFDDSDGAIQAALDDADAFLATVTPETTTEAERITDVVATTTARHGNK